MFCANHFKNILSACILIVILAPETEEFSTECPAFSIGGDEEVTFEGSAASTSAIRTDQQ